MPNENEWTDCYPDGLPTEVGWYATLYCWEPEEGSCAGAHYWDGTKWSKDFPINQCSRDKFLTEKDAHDWAYAHDS